MINPFVLIGFLVILICIRIYMIRTIPVRRVIIRFPEDDQTITGG